MPGDMIKQLIGGSGIERITWGDQSERISLPQGNTPLLPSEESNIPKLERALRLHSVHDYILAGLKPDIIDKNILIPSRYYKLQDDVHTALCQSAKEADDPDTREVLEDACQLLEEVIEDRQLLNMFVNLLHKA